MPVVGGVTTTFNGTEAREGILEPSFQLSALDRDLTIVPDITTKTQVIYYGEIEKATIIDPGCGSTPVTNNIPFRQLFWNPTTVELYVDQCYTDLKANFMAWGRQKGYKEPDLTLATFGDSTSSFWNEWVMERMKVAFARDAFRMAWFGDKAAAVFGSGGNLLNASDVQHYNQVDGLFKRIDTAVAGNQAYRAVISENTQFSTGQVLANDSCIVALKNMYEKCDSRIFDGDHYFLLTRTMYNNLMSSYENKSGDLALTLLQNGQTALSYRGIEVRANYEFDRIIARDSRANAAAAGDVSKLFRPHRALLINRGNMQFGWSIGNTADVFEAWYEKKDKKVYMRGAADVDTQIPHPYILSVAY